MPTLNAANNKIAMEILEISAEAEPGLRNGVTAYVAGKPIRCER